MNRTNRSTTRIWLGLTLFVSALTATSATANIINVPGDQPTIQLGIDAAANGDEVVIAEGLYFEKDINLLGKAVTVRSTDPTNPAIVANTIVSGLIGASAPVFVCDSGEGSGTVISGLTITDGNADSGGGMYNFASSPTVSLCTFSENSAQSGGGMYNLNGSNPTVVDVTFIGNTANFGGGMYNFVNSRPRVTDCTFDRNSAARRGGGMYNIDQSDSIVTGCNFISNSADLGGGFYSGNCNPNVSNCDFTGNTANEGGGMYNFNNSPTVAQSTFDANVATNNGGGMYNTFSRPTVEACTFSENVADNAGGGMYNFNNSASIVNSCTFALNSADVGGGMANNVSRPTVAQCLFNSNSAELNGGGMYNVDSLPTVSDSTFSDNAAVFEGGGIYNINRGNPNLGNSIVWNNTPDEIVDGPNSTTTATYCNIAGGFTGNGNIDADPMFVDAANGDYRLRPGSPSIDAADNSGVPIDLTEDLDGNPRFIDSWYTSDTGNGTAPIVDMGCYEFQATSGPVLTVSPLPLIGGERGTFMVTDLRNNAKAFLHYSLKGTGQTYSPPLNVTLDLQQPRLAGKSKLTDANGFVRWRLPVTAKVRGRNVWLQVAQKNLKTDVVATSVQ